MASKKGSGRAPPASNLAGVRLRAVGEGRRGWSLGGLLWDRTGVGDLERRYCVSGRRRASSALPVLLLSRLNASACFVALGPFMSLISPLKSYPA